MFNRKFKPENTLNIDFKVTFHTIFKIIKYAPHLIYFGEVWTWPLFFINFTFIYLY